MGFNLLSTVRTTGPAVVSCNNHFNLVNMSRLFSSVQFKVVSMRSEKPICAPPRLSEVSPTLPFKRFQCSSDWRWPSLILSRKIFPGISPFHTSLRQAIGGVMSLALCRQVVSQASQHFRSSEKQATCEGCFARQSFCSVVSLHSCIFRTVHPQEFSKVDVDHRFIKIIKNTLIYS